MLMKLACCGTESLLFIKRQYLVGIIRVCIGCPGFRSQPGYLLYFLTYFMVLLSPPPPPGIFQKNISTYVRFGTLTAVSINTMAFRDITRCSLVGMKKPLPPIYDTLP